MHLAVFTSVVILTTAVGASPVDHLATRHDATLSVTEKHQNGREYLGPSTRSDELISRNSTRSTTLVRRVAGWERGKNEGFDLGTKKHCIFMTGFSAESLKATDYMARCHEVSNNYPIAWMKKVTRQGAAAWVKNFVKYTECRPKGGKDKDDGTKVDPDYKKGKPERAKMRLPPDPAACQCDHLLEANEIVEALRYYDLSPSIEGGDQPSQKELKPLTNAEAKTLCQQPEYKKFLQGIEDVMNDVKNMRPLYNDPNQKKSKLIDPLRINKSEQKGVNGATVTKLDNGIDKLKKSFQKTRTPEKAYMAILDSHMKATEKNRGVTAKKIDALIADLEFQDAKAADIWKKMDLARRVGWKNVQSTSPSTREVMYGRMQDMNYRNLNIYDVKVQLTEFRKKVVLAASKKKPVAGDDDSEDDPESDDDDESGDGDDDESGDGEEDESGDGEEDESGDGDEDKSKGQGKSQNKDQSEDGDEDDESGDGDSGDSEEDESGDGDEDKSKGQGKSQNKDQSTDTGKDSTSDTDSSESDDQDSSKDEGTSKSKGQGDAQDEEESGDDDDEEEESDDETSSSD